MPDIKIEKESKFKKLSSENREELALKISDWWEEFHSKRKGQLETAKQLEKYVYLNQNDRNKDKSWKSNIKEHRIYTTWDSIKSLIWRESWSNEDQLFDVQGVSSEFEEQAKTQKSAVTHSLKQMKAGIQFDKATDGWGIYGDFIYKTDWKSRQKKVKRLDPYQGLIEQNLPLEENANIEAINPMFFNFDTTKYRHGDKDSWDSCPKIYKRFASIEEIKANPLYTLTKEQELDLDINEDTKTTEKKADNTLATMKKYGELYEVLYLHGDIKFKGVHYKNVVAEVLAGKYLIFFDENPVYINPFVYGVTELDPETGRGISPLKCILELTKGKEELLNTASDIALLNSQPPHWVSDTFLKEKYKNSRIEYDLGQVLEYENSYQGGFPQPVKFDASGIADVISVLTNDISDTSSINANIMGNVEQGKRTATEMQLASNGANSRTAMKLDKIYQINLQIVENVAELLAMFKTEPEIIMIKDKGQRQSVEINNAIRQGQYQYFYEDRNALVDRRAKFQEAYNIFKEVWGDPDVPLAKQEIVKTGLEMSGFDNADKFFEEKTGVDQIAEMVKQMPPELQEAIMQNMQPMLQQAQMIMAQNQQQQAAQPQQQGVM